MARGLRLSGVYAEAGTESRPGNIVSPSDLPEFVKGEFYLAIRQMASVLDKVIRKPRSLRQFSHDAYVQRTHLATALWNHFLSVHGEEIRRIGKDELLQELEASWLWKVHPYATNKCDLLRPETDGNAAEIRDIEAKRKRLGTLPPPFDHEGRWHHVFWRSDCDYARMAEGIFAHLWEQECEIDGKPREHRGAGSGSSGMGLAEARGHSMASSANDPREKRPAHKTCDWTPATEDIYFKSDIAAAIWSDLCTDPERIFSGQYRAESGERIKRGFAPFFGLRLYEHFKGVLPEGETPPPELWTLHNQVRRHYQLLARSQGLPAAHKSGDREKLLRQVPRDREALLNTLRAHDRNRDIQRLIRLGKLILHSDHGDSPTPEVLAKMVDQMDVLVTSDGQSLIKREEAFVRVWRNAVALSLRTLRIWADPGNILAQAKDPDLASVNVAKTLFRSSGTFDAEHYRRHLALLFGNKQNPVDGNRTRSGLFSDDDPKVCMEHLWAMIRLAGQLRNEINHFNLKSDLVTAVTEGIVTGTAKPRPWDNRSGEEVHADALATFDQLLAFDHTLLGQITVDELNRLQASRYLSPDLLHAVIGEIRGVPVNPPVTPPKFMEVLRRIRGLSDHDPKSLHADLKPFATLDLSNLSKTTEGANHGRIGLLRLLYQGGFQNWLAEKSDDHDLTHAVVTLVLRCREDRAKAFAAEQHRTYALPLSAASDLGLENAETLADLFRHLAVLAAGDSRSGNAYHADTDSQRERASWAEEFKREVFAHLFARYVTERGLSDLHHIGPEGAGDFVPLTIEDIGRDDRDEVPIPWAGCFYAWLYLIPSDDVSLLRHQIRKTMVLEGEKKRGQTPEIIADAATTKALSAMERLMGLYAKVQGAGFQGDEHLIAKGADMAHLFYQNPAWFGDVYDPSMEDRHAAFPGTRRGLRQLLRFGHLNVLRGIFEKHQVTQVDVASFIELPSEPVKALFEQRIASHRRLVELNAEKKIAEDRIAAEAERYRTLAATTILHNFNANAARLTDHARLYQLLMRIIGRLTDFTLMWERDRACFYVGTLYDQSPKTFSVPGDLHDPRWQPNISPLEEPEHFVRYFIGPETENPLDKAANDRRQARGQTLRSSRRGHAKKQIRNDFAHYNVLEKAPVKLSYRINAVRSLLAYDRKLKNAVVTAITEILREDGMEIRWRFQDDRLTQAEVTPLVEAHLAFLKSAALRDRYGFVTPQVSVRYLSMVQALFGFESGGYREVVETPEKVSRTGPLAYPKAFLDRYGDRIPEILRAKYPEI